MKYVDMHCDTADELYTQNVGLYENNLHIDIKKMQKGECLLQNFAVFTNIAKNDSSFTKNVIDNYYRQLDLNKDYIAPIYKYDDIKVNEDKNLISAMLTLEEGSVIDDNLDNLDFYYSKGVRMITLTWNYVNGIGYPNVLKDGRDRDDILYDVNTKDGLTDFGIEYVKKCNELGIIVDVSHLSDAGFYDVLKYSSKPFVASHSNARTVCPVGRNLTDDMIKKLADKGGVMGLNYCADFMHDKVNNGVCKIDYIVEHALHIVNVGGIDCLGLGSDFDGIDNDIEFKNAAGVPLIYEALSKHFNEEELSKIFYKNVLRVYKECMK